jgi:hypothetical protein
MVGLVVGIVGVIGIGLYGTTLSRLPTKGNDEYDDVVASHNLGGHQQM